MPKYIAVTEIRHGARDDNDKYVSTTFSAGDVVTGLSKEDMEGLWKAGAIRKEDGPESADVPTALVSDSSKAASKK